MNLICKLTPMELFFCAKLMDAKYLDYDYFRRIPDIQKQYLLNETTTLEQLDEKGIIELDFDGNATINPEYEDLLQPVFFSEKESRLDVNEKPSRRFHISKNKIIMSLIDEDQITFCRITDEKLLSFFNEKKIEIYFSDVRQRKKTGVFTADDLKIKSRRELALKLLKGEL